MTAQEHALEKLRIAIEQRDWEIAKEAFGILDGTIHAKQEWERPEPFRVPPEVAHMLAQKRNERDAKVDSIPGVSAGFCAPSATIVVVSQEAGFGGGVT